MNAVTDTRTPEQIAQARANNAALLGEYDFYFLVDGSTSMKVADCGSSRSTPRWNYMQESLLLAVGEICKIDTNGVGLIIFADDKVTFQGDNLNAEQVRQALSTGVPGGGTPLLTALKAVSSMAGKSTKKDFIQVWTDGEPDGGSSGQEAIKTFLRQECAQQENDEDRTYQFIQVGYAPGVKSFFTNIDDSLNAVNKRGQPMDIVDCKTQEEIDAYTSIIDVIVDGIND